MWQKFKNNYHLLQAAGASIRFGFPARQMTIIGVTGTDGKTTTSSLIYHILDTAGVKTALISTVAAVINKKKMDTGFHVTTPDAYQLQKYLKLARDVGTQYVVLEVTSHALDQNRIYSIPFTIGVVTNVTHEHLDYHKSYENYLRAKMKLVKIARGAVLNRDDFSYEFFKNHIKKIDDTKIITYGKDVNAEVNPQKFPIHSNIKGEFNTYNTLAAIATCGALGISQKAIESGIETFIMPEGRMELVYSKEFSVLIDFAHTPNAIEQLLKTVRMDVKKPGRIIHVFGSAGKRDRTKRPLMGRSSGDHADVIILTSEDPRDEDPMEIISHIRNGIMPKEGQVIYEVPQRLDAIKKAIELADKNDWVVITGKGHEKSMNIMGKETPWNERKIVDEALKERR